MPLRREIVKRIHWSVLFVEAVLVILSVLLALTLNGWRQNEFHEDLAAQALRNIEDQIRTNKTAVEEALAYHEMLLDDLPEDRGRAVPLKPALIQNNAWETAQATQAVTYIDYDLAALASEVHELQEQYQHTVQAATQSLYLGVTPGRSGDSSTLPMLLDLRSLERLLLERYENLLSEIDA